MQIRAEKRQLSSLVPYERNTKSHPPEQVEAIAASIARFGFNDPIGILPDGRIVEGEGRRLAAMSLGIEEVPVLVLEDFSEKEADLYRIAHNKIALSTGFDMDVLANTLRELVGNDAEVEVDISLKDMGFSSDHVQRIFGSTVPTGSHSSTPVTLRNGRIVAAAPEAPEPTEFVVIWESEEQKQEWEKFVRALRKDGESVGQALSRHINECGVIGAAGQSHTDDGEVNHASN